MRSTWLNLGLMLEYKMFPRIVGVNHSYFKHLLSPGNFLIDVFTDVLGISSI
jgi:hypothetical protein